MNRLWQQTFELGWRAISQRRVQPLFVIDLFEESLDGAVGLGQVAIFIAEHLLVFQITSYRRGHFSEPSPQRCISNRPVRRCRTSASRRTEWPLRCRSVCSLS